jgi:hypothetical protein
MKNNINNLIVNSIYNNIKKIINHYLTLINLKQKIKNIN